VSTPEGSRDQPLVVLIVEDFADAREMYADYLTFAGMTVLTACDGAEGVRLAIEHLPDVIVLDAGLPRLTGWEATAMLRGNPDTEHLKILMLTGHVFRDSEHRARDAGVDVFVAKPCLPDQLHRHVVALAGRAGSGGEHPMQRTPDPKDGRQRRAARPSASTNRRRRLSAKSSKKS
jgi:two-component system cell cycle response regulator DivK